MYATSFKQGEYTPHVLKAEALENIRYVGVSEHTVHIHFRDDSFIQVSANDFMTGVRVIAKQFQGEDVVIQGKEKDG